MKAPKNALDMLLLDRGSLARIAGRLRVNRSMVTMVMKGERTSARVLAGIISESRRLARLYGAAAALLEIENLAR